jgi:hypothetical protein
MSFVIVTLIVIGAIVIFGPLAAKMILFKPKQYRWLSQAAYDEQMRNLEFLRRNAIEASNTQLEIDQANERYDAQEAQYKVKRRYMV